MVRGAAEVTVKYRDQTAQVTLTVVEGQGASLLGRDWLQHLRLDWRSLNQVTQDSYSELETILCTHSALFYEGFGYY